MAAMPLDRVPRLAILAGTSLAMSSSLSIASMILALSEVSEPPSDALSSEAWVHPVRARDSETTAAGMASASFVTFMTDPGVSTLMKIIMHE